MKKGSRALNNIDLDQNPKTARLAVGSHFSRRMSGDMPANVIRYRVWQSNGDHR